MTYHLENAKAHGVTRREIAAIVTHVGFYVGWPKAWAVFRLAKEVWNESEPELTEKDKYKSKSGFTKQYAEWIAQETGCELIPEKAANISAVKGCDVLVYGSRMHGLDMMHFWLR